LSHGLFAECFVVDFGGFIFSWSLADKLVFAQATTFFIFELFLSSDSNHTLAFILRFLTKSVKTWQFNKTLILPCQIPFSFEFQTEPIFRIYLHLSLKAFYLVPAIERDETASPLGALFVGLLPSSRLA